MANQRAEQPFQLQPFLFDELEQSTHHFPAAGNFLEGSAGQASSSTSPKPGRAERHPDTYRRATAYIKALAHSRGARGEQLMDAIQKMHEVILTDLANGKIGDVYQLFEDQSRIAPLAESLRADLERVCNRVIKASTRRWTRDAKFRNRQKDLANTSGKSRNGILIPNFNPGIGQQADPLFMAMLRFAMKQLSWKQFRIFRAHIWHGLTFRDIANLIKSDPATVHKLYVEAIEKIKSFFQPDQSS